MANLIINLKGGTGNQLFQIAAILSLAKTYKTNCKFSIDNINNKYRRKIEIFDILQDFGVNENIGKSKKDIFYLDEYDIDHPLYFSISSPLALLEKDIQLDGYFLNYRIHDKEVIKKIKTSINKLQVVEKIEKIKFIAIHLRESHIVYSRNIKKRIKTDILDINYYIEALERIRKNPNFSDIKNAIVFSDMFNRPNDSKLLPQIKDILQTLGFNYLNGDNEINSPLEIINIVSLSKCCIISNSTLSWWGAYLSNGKIFSPVMNIWEPNLKVPDHWEQIYAGEIKPKTHHRKNVFETFSFIEKSSSFHSYSYQRIKIVKIFRKLSNITYRILKLNNFRKCFKTIGLSFENDNKTYF